MHNQMTAANHGPGGSHVQSQLRPHHVWCHTRKSGVRPDAGIESPIQSFRRLFAAYSRLVQHSRKPAPQSLARLNPPQLKLLLCVPQRPLRLCVCLSRSLFLIHSARRRVQFIHKHFSTLHHKLHLLQFHDVLQWVPAHCHNICVRSLTHHSQLPLPIQHLRRA